MYSINTGMGLALTALVRTPLELLETHMRLPMRVSDSSRILAVLSERLYVRTLLDLALVVSILGAATRMHTCTHSATLDASESSGPIYATNTLVWASYISTGSASQTHSVEVPRSFQSPRISILVQVIVNVSQEWSHYNTARMA